jgi:hypothetical protein
MSEQPQRTSLPSPAFVALAGWIIPGSGYLLLRDYARGITVGITIVLLFFLGLIIGGIRCLEVPGFDAHGHKMFSYYTRGQVGDQPVLNLHVVPEVMPSGPGVIDAGWILTKRPIDELRNKPWNIPQILIGPLDLICDYWSTQVARPIDKSNLSLGYVAVRSHSRVNELGVLYTAVAGLLNLLAIIDSSHRAVRLEAV